jgi:hypothetical protein
VITLESYETCEHTLRVNVELLIIKAGGAYNYHLDCLIVFMCDRNSCNVVRGYMSDIRNSEISGSDGSEYEDDSHLGYGATLSCRMV